LAALLASRGAMPEPLLSIVARQLLLTLRDVHSSHKFVGDLCPRDVCIRDDGTLFCCCFGAFGFKPEETLNHVRSPAYCAPEVVRRLPAMFGRNRGEVVDVWSLGVLLAELYLGQHPYTSAEMEANSVFNPEPYALLAESAMKLIGQAQPPKWVRSFLSSALERFPESRAGTATLLQKDFITRHEYLPAKTVLTWARLQSELSRNVYSTELMGGDCTSMTSEQQERTRQIFRRYTLCGPDGSYATNKKHLGTILNKVFGTGTIDLDWAMSILDTDHNGAVEEDEFIVWWTSLNFLDAATARL